VLLRDGYDGCRRRAVSTAHRDAAELPAMFIAMAMAMAMRLSPASVIGNALRRRHQRLPGECARARDEITSLFPCQSKTSSL
jgi:hypothetical protein